MSKNDQDSKSDERPEPTPNPIVIWFKSYWGVIAGAVAFLAAFATIVHFMVAGPIQGLNYRIDAAFERIDTASENLGGVADRLDKTTTRLEKAEQHLTTLDTALRDLEDTVQANTAAIEQLQDIIARVQLSGVAPIQTPVRIWLQDGNPPYSDYDPVTASWSGYDVEIAEALAEVLQLAPTDLEFAPPTSLEDFLDLKCDYDLALVDLSDPVWSTYPVRNVQVMELSPFMGPSVIGPANPGIVVPVCDPQDMPLAQGIFYGTYLVPDLLWESIAGP